MRLIFTKFCGELARGPRSHPLGVGALVIESRYVRVIVRVTVDVPGRTQQGLLWLVKFSGLENPWKQPLS